jgi:hypothetical protein
MREIDCVMKIWSSCLSLLVALVTSPLLLTATGVRAAPAGAVESIASIPFSTGGFDISWVDQSTGRYFQADGNNNQVDWFDATTTDASRFFVRALAHGEFAGGQGLVEVATRDLNPGSTHHAVVVTGNDLPGTVGDIGITPGATYWYETVTLTSSGPEIDNNGGKCYRVTIPAA